MIPVFHLALVDATDGRSVAQAPGNVKLEVELGEEIIKQLAQVPIGFFTRRAAVEDAIREAVAAIGMDLRKRSILAMQHLPAAYRAL